MLNLLISLMPIKAHEYFKDSIQICFNYANGLNKYTFCTLEKVRNINDYGFLYSCFQ